MDLCCRVAWAKTVVPVGEVVAVELRFPVTIRIELIDHNRAMLAAMSGEVALAVAVDVETARHAPGPAPEIFQNGV